MQLIEDQAIHVGAENHLGRCESLDMIVGGVPADTKFYKRSGIGIGNQTVSITEVNVGAGDAEPVFLISESAHGLVSFSIILKTRRDLKQLELKIPIDLILHFVGVDRIVGIVCRGFAITFLHAPSAVEIAVMRNF